MREIGRFLILIGAMIVLAGTAFTLADKISWFGRLPGDFIIKRKEVVVYIPIVTGLLLSIFLSILLTSLKR